MDRPEFSKRLAAAIETLERAIASGKLAAWGLATWDGLRAPPEHPEHLSIAATLETARDVAGDGHHFRAVQLPFNLAMAQAVAFPSQPVGEKRLSALAAARELRLGAFGSASLLQGRLAGDLPEEIEEAFPEASTGGQRALQFARSAPGMSTSLVGVSNVEHAKDNFALTGIPPASPDAVMGLFE